jgi:hypothetical protein
MENVPFPAIPRQSASWCPCPRPGQRPNPQFARLGCEATEKAPRLTSAFRTTDDNAGWPVWVGSGQCTRLTKRPLSHQRHREADGPLPARCCHSGQRPSRLFNEVGRLPEADMWIRGAADGLGWEAEGPFLGGDALRPDIRFVAGTGQNQIGRLRRTSREAVICSVKPSGTGAPRTLPGGL